MSGGVDSSVTASLIDKAIGSQLTCIFVDHGLLRKNEGQEVREIFSKNFTGDFIYVDAKDLFLKKKSKNFPKSLSEQIATPVNNEEM